ncbi:MAG: hypothetical protein ABJF50_12055 [Paracoccaceae bacterium]
MLNSISKLALAVLIATPLQVSAQENEGRRIAEDSFKFIAGSERGWIDQGTFLKAGGDVFAAMDYDQDLKLTLGEFLVFDIGMREVAEKAGRLDAHETAMRVVFAFWDRDGDGQVSSSEHKRSLSYDFQRADIDDNARLNLDEYISGFTVMVALRAAINPAPVE